MNNSLAYEIYFIFNMTLIVDNMKTLVAGEMSCLLLCVGMPSVFDGVALTEDNNAYSRSVSHNLFTGEYNLIISEISRHACKMDVSVI